MEKFETRVLGVEAMYFDGSPQSAAKMVTWLPKTAEYHHALMDGVLVAHPDPYLRIFTKGTTAIINPGEWVLKGPDGFSAISMEDFEATYKSASEGSEG